MTRTSTGRRFWRQLTGCIVAYALVLQGVLAAVSGAELANIAATPDGTPGFELCLHDADGAPGLPPNHDGKSHCVLCLAGGHHFVAAPVPPLRLALREARTTVWPLDDWRIAVPTGPLSHRPRGPPLAT